MPTLRVALRDLLALALILSLAAPVVLGIAQVFNEADSRIVCASNLHQIGIGMMLYANENRGSFPKTLYDQAKPTPTWGTPYEGNAQLGALPPEQANPFDSKATAAPAANDVTAAMFMILRTIKIEPQAFVCPSSGQTPMDFGTGNTKLNWTNWQGTKGLRDHLSYSFSNPYVSLKAREQGWKWNNMMGAEFPLAADMNPGTAALLKLSAQSLPIQMVPGNSLNHFSGGQNVLYADSHVTFTINPFVGVNQDNIYTFGVSGKDKPTGGEGFIGSPVNVEDAVLLPTARELGITDEKGEVEPAFAKRMKDARDAMRPPTQAEIDQKLKEFFGTYTTNLQGAGQCTLELTKDRGVITTPKDKFVIDFKIVDVRDKHIRVQPTNKDFGAGPSNITLEGDGIEFSLLIGTPDGHIHWTRQP